MSSSSDALHVAIQPSDPVASQPADAGAPGLAEVPAPLRDAMAARGFTQLTDVQQAVLRAQAENGAATDLRISSQTGSGKTVALGLALAPELTAGSPGAGTSVLVLVPTRELAEQVRGELTWLLAGLGGVRIECVTGGTSVQDEQRRLRRCPRVVVGTPGRVLDHVRSQALDCRGLAQLVLDEADQMLDMGFRDDLDAILAALPKSRRTHMVSATFPPEVQELVERFQRTPLLIEGTRPGIANADIDHWANRVHSRDRYAALVNLLLLQDGARTLVFVRTRQDTGALAERLEGDGFAALPLSGELAQAQRTRTLNAFRSGAATVLVATDVAARGLDVPEVTTVVHFDLPIDDQVYVHRSGRTGRAGRKGRSVVLVTPMDARRVQRLARGAGVAMAWADAPGPDVVRAAEAERARGRVQAMLEGSDAPDDGALAAARAALSGRDAVDVVARLLVHTRRPPAREPMPLTPPSLPPAPARHARLPGARRPVRRAPAYVRFAINWGTRKGATPQRLLAHVCRRGGIAGHQIGVIAMLPHSATFEVDAAIAEPFAARVRVPDPREPHLVIARADGGR